MKKYTFSFRTGHDDWTGDFADYPKAQERTFDLEFGYSALPAPLISTSGSIRQSGNNHSDDLFMFSKRKISGLVPNQSYSVNFMLNFATNAADNSMGVGGSPGNSVYVKAGATRTEPKKILNASTGYYRMNIDKGNQAKGGKDMMLLGDFANGSNRFEYKFKQLKNSTPFMATADANGELWLIVGTDSGFEATTTIYYNIISVTFQ